MAELLPTTNYPAVRAALDVTLSASMLPDSIIALDIYDGAAERDVLAIDPDAESRMGDELLRAQTAAIYFCAARLAGSIPQVFRETRADHSYERTKDDPAANAAELRALALKEISTYLDIDPSSARPTFFTVAPGRRGVW